MEAGADVRIQRAIELIEESLHTSLRMVDLAEAAGLSTVHFTRLFKDATGTTPGAYLHERRMVRARILVERTSLPISEIMRQVGLSDRSHFGRDFKRAHGFSPRSLRVQLKMTGEPGRRLRFCG